MELRPICGPRGCGNPRSFHRSARCGDEPSSHTPVFGAAPGGRITIPVLPTNGHEWLLLRGTATASWGAFPGATIDNVHSGIGTVHNALLIDRPERTIVRGPFRPFRPFPRSSLRHSEPDHRVTPRVLSPIV